MLRPTFDGRRVGSAQRQPSSVSAFLGLDSTRFDVIENFLALLMNFDKRGAEIIPSACHRPPSSTDGVQAGRVGDQFGKFGSRQAVEEIGFAEVFFFILLRSATWTESAGSR